MFSSFSANTFGETLRPLRTSFSARQRVQRQVAGGNCLYLLVEIRQHRTK
jgi:hypothetical protein